MQYVPVRLTLKQRKTLRLLVASLGVSDYTGRVDRPNLMKGAKRMHQQLKEMCSMFTGLVLATDRKCGRGLIKSREFAQYTSYFTQVYEVMIG